MRHAALLVLMLAVLIAVMLLTFGCGNEVLNIPRDPSAAPVSESVYTYDQPTTQPADADDPFAALKQFWRDTFGQ